MESYSESSQPSSSISHVAEKYNEKSGRVLLRAFVRSETLSHVNREAQGVPLDPEKLQKLSWAINELAARADRAMSLGPVELINLAEFKFRHNYNQLRAVRRLYSDFCLSLLAELEKDGDA
jgi:hypothetical protein